MLVQKITFCIPKEIYKFEVYDVDECHIKFNNYQFSCHQMANRFTMYRTFNIENSKMNVLSPYLYLENQYIMNIEPVVKFIQIPADYIAEIKINVEHKNQEFEFYLNKKFIEQMSA